jgi:hypothetical protein
MTNIQIASRWNENRNLEKYRVPNELDVISLIEDRQLVRSCARLLD